MKKKKIWAIVAVVLIFLVGGNVIHSLTAEKKQNRDDLIEGIKLVSYEIEKYMETESEDYFHQASSDLQSLEQIAENDSYVLFDEYRKKAFISLINAFKYDSGELMNYAEKLKRVFELIGEGTDESYPYDQINIILEDISA